MAAWLAARGFKRSDDPVPRIAAMVAIGSIVAYSVHCYGDIGFQSFPCGLILGAALATAGKVAAWSEASPVEQAASTLAADGNSVRGRLARDHRNGVATHVAQQPMLRRLAPQGAARAADKPDRQLRRRLPR